MKSRTHTTARGHTHLPYNVSRDPMIASCTYAMNGLAMVGAVLQEKQSNQSYNNDE